VKHDWVARLRRAALQGALLGATSCGGMSGPQVDAGQIVDAGTIVDGGSSFPPCTPRSIDVTLFDGGARTISACEVVYSRCEPIPDSGVCTRRDFPPFEGPFARAGAESGCCYFPIPHGRPLRDEEGASLASLALRSDWT